MRLIDADALKHEIAKAMTSRTEVSILVDGMPDAIVRCKDCKHYEQDKFDPGKGDCNGNCDNLVKVYDDWFCADGERQKGR